MQTAHHLDITMEALLTHHLLQGEPDHPGSAQLPRLAMWMAIALPEMELRNGILQPPVILSHKLTSNFTLESSFLVCKMDLVTMFAPSIFIAIP
jgi:hypothetical protein